jgi:ActR/RegA family two-component response regulator
MTGRILIVDDEDMVRPAMRVVVITGSVSNITTPIVPGVEVDGFLIKPFGIDEIREMIEKVVGK